MIKDNTGAYPTDRMQRFSRFHEQLFRAFEEKLKGEKHVIMKMSSYWEYFSQAFPDSQRLIKKIMKTKTFEDYDAAYKTFADIN